MRAGTLGRESTEHRNSDRARKKRGIHSDGARACRLQESVTGNENARKPIVAYGNVPRTGMLRPGHRASSASHAAIPDRHQWESSL